MAQWQEFGSEGKTPLVFLPANGFTVGSYRFLLKPLAQQYRVLAFESRGAWPQKEGPQPGFNWAAHARFNCVSGVSGNTNQFPPRNGGRPLHCATVSAIAARKRPDLFERLVLIDSATILGGWMPLMMRLMPSLAGRTGLVTRTKARRVQWQSPDDFAAYHRGKSAYKRFTEQALADYAQAALHLTEKGFELVYGGNWEDWNFQHTAVLWPVVRKLKLPTLVLRGEHSYMHPEAEFQRHCRRLPAAVKVMTVPSAGHMPPQEAPDTVLSTILDWLS